MDLSYSDYIPEAIVARFIESLLVANTVVEEIPLNGAVSIMSRSLNYEFAISGVFHCALPGQFTNLLVSLIVLPLLSS